MSELNNKSEDINIWNSYRNTTISINEAEAQLKSPPQLDENQQDLLHKLKVHYNTYEGSAEKAIYGLLVYSHFSDGDIANDDLFIVLDSFKNWVQKQEKE